MAQTDAAGNGANHCSAGGPSPSTAGRHQAPGETVNPAFCCGLRAPDAGTARTLLQPAPQLRHRRAHGGKCSGRGVHRRKADPHVYGTGAAVVLSNSDDALQPDTGAVDPVQHDHQRRRGTAQPAPSKGRQHHDR